MSATMLSTYLEESALELSRDDILLSNPVPLIGSSQIMGPDSCTQAGF